MKKVFLFALVILIVLWIVGCSTNDTTSVYPVKNTPVPTPVSNYEWSEMNYASLNGFGRRLIDKEAGVVCYFLAGGTGVTVSCLSIKDTLLGNN
jgi:hypothetical protein